MYCFPIYNFTTFIPSVYFKINKSATIYFIIVMLLIGHVGVTSVFINSFN